MTAGNALMAFAALLGGMGVIFAVVARGREDLLGVGVAMILGAVAVAAVTATARARRDEDRQV
jgi:drug/metabolite transporter (DMT)-like permease